MRWFIPILLLFFLAGYTSAWWFIQPNLNDQVVEVEIKKGDNLSNLAGEWQQEGWLRSSLTLKLAARITGLGKVRPGTFSIPPKLTNQELLEYLAEAKPRQYALTLIEGKPIAHAIQILSEAQKLDQDMGELTEDKIKQLLGVQGSVEGLLYPDTYLYQPHEKVSVIIQQAAQRLEQVLQSEWENRAKNLPYEFAYEALIMASIVEKETGVGYERPMIAGVFVRRLNKSMRLETDPTVIYGLGNEYDGNLKRDHLRDNTNPYNTYRHKGLPPSPIALAGQAAIHAALNPAEGSELFFVAKGDGSHQFSETLAEHNEAVRRYQLQRRSDYRSSPAPVTNSRGSE